MTIKTFSHSSSSFSPPHRTCTIVHTIIQRASSGSVFKIHILSRRNARRFPFLFPEEINESLKNARLSPPSSFCVDVVSVCVCERERFFLLSRPRSGESFFPFQCLISEEEDEIFFPPSSRCNERKEKNTCDWRFPISADMFCCRAHYLNFVFLATSCKGGVGKKVS